MVCINRVQIEHILISDCQNVYHEDVTLEYFEVATFTIWKKKYKIKFLWVKMWNYLYNTHIKCILNFDLRLRVLTKIHEANLWDPSIQNGIFLKKMAKQFWLEDFDNLCIKFSCTRCIYKPDAYLLFVQTNVTVSMTLHHFFWSDAFNFYWFINMRSSKYSKNKII